MILPAIVLTLGLANLGNEETLDAFRYADTAAAAKAWTALEQAPPAQLVRDGSRDVLELQTPFATNAKLTRTVADRAVKLDLAGPGEFAIEVWASAPESVGSVSLYFRSGDGWYAGSADLRSKDWQVLRFSKASFRTEGTPAGWNQIDGIRLAFWRGSAKDGTVRIARLTATWRDVALVVPAESEKAESEVRAARVSAELVADMLSELGLGTDAVEEPSLARGALGQRRIAILAYNPRLSDETVEALDSFVRVGGKLLVCYQIPEKLGETLGIGRTRYVRPQPADQFAEIRFDAPDVAGLPKSVRQDSWNITVAEPTGHDARVIGRWFDPQGKPTGHAAMLVSSRGAFFSHIVISDDREGKKQMLAAVLGHLEPRLWQEMVRGEMARTGKIGHLDSVEEVARYVQASRNIEAEQALQRALQSLAEAKLKMASEAYPEAARQIREARELLAEAYLRATPSRAPEGRAFWEHSGLGAYPGDWDRTAKELAGAGFNMVIPNMLWGGVAHYASDVLPRSEVFRKHGDQIAQCVAAAHKHGIEVHVWKVNYNLSRAPRDFVERLRAEGRTQVSRQGESHDWLCPSHPENFKLELESMLEVARKYEVDGLHFDYIRYPDGDHCYCDGCRQRFEKDSGRKVARWPDDCFRGERREEYRDWRCRQITRLVEAVHREAKKIRPGIKISAAVFGSYPSCRESVGQDWPAWIKAGYLDFVCPMDYTESDLAFSALVANQLELVGGRIPIYPGIGATASRTSLTADRVVAQIYHARSLSAGGFCIFNLDRRTIGSIVPGVGLGVGVHPAQPPHRPAK